MQFTPRYANSHALVVGINEYQYWPNLLFAENDAQAVARLLTGELRFPDDNVALLLGRDATRDHVLEEFYRFRGIAGSDDRVFVFYAGHGHTVSGHRGDVGFLVPYDGKGDDPSSWIRWREFTDGADLIAAKHVLFIMDSCYGGLAVSRGAPVGGARFLKDMLLRRSRQVLTAGKGDEVVSDGNGPRPGHSVFTGHLLDGLEGAAAANDGILTANTLMAFVYDRVGKDPLSCQTPHFGHVVGDGDFIFRAAILDQIEADETKDSDVMVHLPALTLGAEEDVEDLTATLKECLSDDRLRIRLHDQLSAEVRTYQHSTRVERFPVSEPRGDTEIVPEFLRRLDDYESALERLRVGFVILARWGRDEHLRILNTMLSRVADPIDTVGGLVVWTGLRWYPPMLLIYTSGIAALAGGNYAALAELFSVRHENDHGRGAGLLFQSAVDGLLELDRVDMFKRLPGHERQYVPRSEYLLKRLQPMLDDLLFLGSDYELLFDQFEVFLALTYADLDRHDGEPRWGPPGRFAWKERGLRRGPLRALIDEATARGDAWGPLRAGMFGGSGTRFEEVAEAYMVRVRNLGWH